MAQAMTVCGFCGHASAANSLRRHPSLLSQIQKIKPAYSHSHLFFSPLPSLSPPPSSSPLKTFALFKSKAKAPPKKVEKPKKKVESGIFGTSGGIGFTKQNELFVGRVAMIGFANKQNAIDRVEEFHNQATSAPAILATVVALSVLLCSGAQAQEDGVVRRGGSALFRQACIGCHVGGGNVIQPGATLFAGDLERNGVTTEDEIYKLTNAGKGRMPGFGEQCSPRGQCTFGPRLKDEEIRLLAQFVKLQAQQGWPNAD